MTHASESLDRLPRSGLTRLFDPVRWYETKSMTRQPEDFRFRGPRRIWLHSLSITVLIGHCVVVELALASCIVSGMQI